MARHEMFRNVRMPIGMVPIGLCFGSCFTVPVWHAFSQTNFKGRVFMTHPTKAVYKWMLADFVKVRCVQRMHDGRNLHAWKYVLIAVVCAVQHDIDRGHAVRREGP